MILGWNIRFAFLRPLGLCLRQCHIDQFARHFGRLVRLLLINLIRQGLAFVEEGNLALPVFADRHVRLAEGIAGPRGSDLIELACIL